MDSDRKTVQAELKTDGIETRRFFHPLHRQPIIPKAGIREEFPGSGEDFRKRHVPALIHRHGIIDD